MLQAHPEPLIPQEPLLINGMVHANGQVEPLNGLQLKHFYTVVFNYRLMCQLLKDHPAVASGQQPVGNVLNNCAYLIAAAGRQYALTLRLCNPIIYEYPMAFHLTMPHTLSYSGLASCEIVSCAGNTTRTIQDVWMDLPAPVCACDYAYNDLLERLELSAEGEPISINLECVDNSSESNASAAMSATTSEQNDTYLRMLFIKTGPLRVHIELPTPPYSPVYPITPPSQDASLETPGAPVLSARELPQNVRADVVLSTPMLGTVNLPPVTVGGIKEVCEAERQLLDTAMLPELTAEALNYLASIIIPGFKNSNVAITKGNGPRTYDDSIHWMASILRGLHSRTSSAPSHAEEPLATRAQVAALQDSVDQLAAAFQTFALYGHRTESSAPLASSGTTISTPADSSLALTRIREPLPAPQLPPISSLLMGAPPLAIFLNGYPTLVYTPLFVFPAIAPPVIPGLYEVDEPSKTDHMATQINTVIERLDELVDEMLAHHHTQIEHSIEQASKSFGVEADKIISKLGDHVESMGDYIVESETERHEDVLNDVAHVGFHVVQTQAAVGALHEHLHDAMVLVAAGFYAMAEDNKTRDEQFKARFDFTERTAILLIQIQTFVRNELHQVQHTISENLDHQVAHGCKQHKALVNTIHGHARRVLEGYDHIIKHQDGLFNQIERQLDERFSLVSRQRKQTDDILTRTYHDVHSVRLNLTNLMNEVYEQFQELIDYTFGVLNVFLFTAHSLFLAEVVVCHNKDNRF
jgi:hypothetical protein